MFISVLNSQKVCYCYYIGKWVICSTGVLLAWGWFSMLLCWFFYWKVVKIYLICWKLRLSPKALRMVLWSFAISWSRVSGVIESLDVTQKVLQEICLIVNYFNKEYFGFVSAPKSSSSTKSSTSSRGIPLYPSYPTTFTLPTTLGLSSAQPLNMGNTFLFSQGLSGGQMILGRAPLGSLPQRATSGAVSEGEKPNSSPEPGSSSVSS